MVFVQSLSEFQRFGSAEAVTTVGLALQAGEIKEQRRRLFSNLIAVGLHAAELPCHTGGDLFGVLLLPEARLLASNPFTIILPGLSRELRLDLPEWLGVELANLIFPMDQEG